MNQQGKIQRGRNYKNAYTVKFKQMVTMGKGYMIVYYCFNYSVSLKLQQNYF